MAQCIEWNDRYATKQTPWDSGEPSKELERILDQRGIKPGRALELGCGTGTNAVFLAGRGFDVTAIDLSPLAIEQAQARARQAGVSVRFQVGDVLNLPDLGPAFPFVFDRGVYHHLRSVDLKRFLEVLVRVTQPSGLYLTLAGNANDPSTPPDQGPPTVRAEEICTELSLGFELVQLREFYFDGVKVDGRLIRPLAWSALLRRKAS